MSRGAKLSAGVAWEPTPIPENRRYPGWFRGDALVYAAGAELRLAELKYGHLGLAFAYSFHDVDDVRDDRPPFPESAPPLYESCEQVWSLGLSWTY